MLSQMLSKHGQKQDRVSIFLWDNFNRSVLITTANESKDKFGVYFNTRQNGVGCRVNP